MVLLFVFVVALVVVAFVDCCLHCMLVAYLFDGCLC